MIALLATIDPYMAENVAALALILFAKVPGSAPPSDTTQAAHRRIRLIPEPATAARDSYNARDGQPG